MKPRGQVIFIIISLTRLLTETAVVKMEFLLLFGESLQPELDEPYELQSSAPPHQIIAAPTLFQRFEFCAEEPKGLETPRAPETHTHRGNVKRRRIITETKKIHGDNSMLDKASNQGPRAFSRKRKNSMAG